ncbi:MAG: hypothetical protein ABWY83_00575, partial [Actinomycetota bacterium]
IAQLGIATSVETSLVARRASAERVGLRVRALAGRQPCHVFSEVNYPIMSYAAGCRGTQVGKVLRWDERAERLEDGGIRPFLVLYGAAEREVSGATLLAVVPSDDQTRWFIYGYG